MIESAETNADIYSFIHELRDHYQIANIIYHGLNLPGPEAYIVLATCDPIWVKQYLDHQMVDTDPIIRSARCGLSIGPTSSGGKKHRTEPLKRGGHRGLQFYNEIIGTLLDSDFGRPQRSQACSHIERTRILLRNVGQEQFVGGAVV